MEDNNIPEANKLEENDNIRPEPDNNTDNYDAQEEITGVTEEDNNNTVPIPEEKKSRLICNTGRYKHYVRNEHKQ